ncbi:DEAD/DEAH box helicase [Chengkuizengella sp. SCS-71B]|uniref:DEAD/DEAH box helicase n=1 Tax=Chengkuizengella sp. SCS-71B TaxID=3115290 RepID=UPI0032C21EA7
MDFKPHKYQEYAIERILDTSAIALLLEMGLGKTVITLTAIEQMLFDTFEASKILVIAPLRVADDTWSRESQKWDHLKHLRISKILGSRMQRERGLNADADLYVMNRENVSWLVSMTGKDWPFETVVIDELSSFKNSKSQRFRALKRVRPLMQRVIGLTGTPTPNGLEDLWSQMYLIDQGERLGKTITRFRDRYLNAGQRDKNNSHVVYEWKPKPEAEKNVYEKISDIAVSMRAEDWLDMPERMDRIIPIKLNDESTKQYKKLERDLLLPFADGDVVANTAAVLSNKLLQMANGAVYDETRGVKEIHEAKLDALEDIIEAANGHPILVFYAFKHDLERIQDRFKFTRTLGKGSDDIEDWNNGNIQMLAVHPASAGHGLNLQDGGNLIVWFGLNWSLELYQQANARLHRQGQKRSVVVHHLVTEGTMDEDVMNALDGKATGQDALMEAVKARIEKVKE